MDKVCKLRNSVTEDGQGVNLVLQAGGQVTTDNSLRFKYDFKITSHKYKTSAIWCKCYNRADLQYLLAKHCTVKGRKHHGFNYPIWGQVLQHYGELFNCRGWLLGNWCTSMESNQSPHISNLERNSFIFIQMVYHDRYYRK